MALAGQVALVTGAGRGIGRDVARGLLASGASVFIASRTTDELAQAVDELSSFGDVAAATCDVSRSKAVDALVTQVKERFGSLDILVCSHGVLNAGHSVLDFPRALWNETIAVNLTGTFYCAQAAARIMVAQNRGGRIIIISSIVAFASVAHESAYDASKGGIEALTRAMALDLAQHGITVNSVAPGSVATPMVSSILPPGAAFRGNPVRRSGEPGDVTRAVVWLAQPTASYITGTTIVVDGGQRALLAGSPVRD